MPGASARWKAAFALASMVAATLGIAVACGTADDPGLGPPLPASSSGAPTSGSSTSNGACSDGETQECHITISEHGDVLTCYSGTQTCSGGTWGACADGVMSARSASRRGEGGERERSGENPSPLSLTDAGTCVGLDGGPNNPCDPACQQFDENPDGGIPTEAGPSGTYSGGTIGDLPGGFQSKGLKQPCLPDNGDCQFDHHCVGGVCVPYNPGEKNPACPGVEITAGPTCTDVVPVCNRGNTTAPAGIQVVVFTGNSSQMQDNLGLCASFSGTVAGSCVTSQPIPPGLCVNVAGCPLGGTQSILVNPPSPPGATPPVAECQCGNNWTVYHNGSTCGTTTINSLQPSTYKQTYTSVCPAGTRVQWGYLSYVVQTPSNASGATSVTIQAHTALTAAALAPTCADCVTLAAVPASSPQSCPVVGVAGCPKDVYTALGGLPKATDSVIELVFSLQPSPDAQIGPKVVSWDLTYSCPASE
jgi:hypothetical protein